MQLGQLRMQLSRVEEDRGREVSIYLYFAQVVLTAGREVSKRYAILVFGNGSTKEKGWGGGGHVKNPIL